MFEGRKIWASIGAIIITLIFSNTIYHYLDPKIFEDHWDMVEVFIILYCVIKEQYRMFLSSINSLLKPSADSSSDKSPWNES